MEEQSFIASIHQKTNPDLLQFCQFSCFLSQEEPKKISDALKDPSKVLKNKKDKRGIVIRNKARLVAQRHTQEEGIDYEEVFAPVARIKAIRLFLAYASFIGFTVYQMDVKSDFLYDTIDEEVYVMQPPRFQDPLAFCDYHNMIIILEKSEHNVDFHQIVDFVEASHIRIETTNEGTQILTTVDGKPRTICESSIRRNLKLNDEEGISTLPDAELFKNLALMGQYSRRATQISQSKALPTAADEPASPLGDNSQGAAFPTISGLEVGQDRENIIKTSTLPYESTPRVTSLAADEGSMQQQLHELMNLCTLLQRQQTEMATKITAQDLEISNLKARIKLLEDKDKGTTELSGDDAPIKGISLETGDEAGVERSTEKGSNDTEEMVNVLTFMDATNILTSGVQALSVPPVGEIPAVGVSTSSGLVPIVSAIFTTASVVTPYLRRKGKEKMVESDMPKKNKLQEQIDVQMAREIEEEMAIYAQRMNEQIARDAEIARIHAEEELQMMIDGLDRNNEMIAKHLHEYEQAAAELTIGEKIELINELQQRKFYTSVLRSHSGWKTKHFRGMTLEEIKEKFIPVWKQIEDFVPMDLKEEGERFKRKWLRLEQGSAKKMKTSKEVTEEDLKEMMQLVPVEEVYVEALQVKHPIIDWEIHTEGKRDYWKIIRLGGNTAVYQVFVDMLKQMDREDLNQLWMLVKETLSIRHASSDKEKELWVELKRLFEPDHEDQLWTHTQALMHDPLEWKLYDTCGVHYIFTRDQEIFMLVERDYPLRR
nr:putative ribonuclease H-like domain-containing protein [Tanacetum cinerariifolium]